MSAEKLMQVFTLAQGKIQVKGILQGTVKSVDGYDTCTVEVMDGLELYNVRLNAIEGLAANQVTLKPKIGSKVLVGIIENVKTQAAVLKYGELEEYFIKIGTASIRVKESKVKIESEGENLGDVISQAIAEVKKIVVIYGRSPNVAALTAIDLKLKKILD